MSTVPHMGEKINKAEKRMAGHERGGLIQSPRASRRVASHRIRSWSMPWHTGSSRSAILWSGGGRRRRTTPLYVLIQERILAPAPGIRIDLLACSHPTCSSVQSFCAKQITIKKTQRTADPSGCLVDLCASGSEPLFHERETMDWAGRADKVACIQRRVAHGSSIAGIPAGASGTTTSTRAGATPTWRAPASNTPHGLGRVVLELLSSSGVWRNKCYRDSGRRAGEGSRRRSGHHARAPTGTKNLMRSLVSLSSLAMLASCLTIGRTTG
jgi:hypothetical protein